MASVKITGAALAASVAMLVAISLNANAAGDDNPHPLMGDYIEFSGLLGDSDVPTKKDMKVAIHIKGKLAADMFQHLGRSAEKTGGCWTEAQLAYRERRDLICVLHWQAGAECWLGIDPATGGTVAGIVC
jgi:hypothetical protein